MKYTVQVPFIDDMGSTSPFAVSDKLTETKEEEALWTLNRMRDHDGLEPLEELPEGCTFTPRN